MHVVVRAVFLPLFMAEKKIYKADIKIVLDGQTISAVCQDVQFHPVSDMPIHVDFLRK